MNPLIKPVKGNFTVGLYIQYRVQFYVVYYYYSEECVFVSTSAI